MTSTSLALPEFSQEQIRRVIVQTYCWEGLHPSYNGSCMFCYGWRYIEDIPEGESGYSFTRAYVRYNNERVQVVYYDPNLTSNVVLNYHEL